jgi:hypothetical protein
MISSSICPDIGTASVAIYHGRRRRRPSLILIYKRRMKRMYTIQHRFNSFITNNPQVYDMAKKISLGLRHKGYVHCGISLVWERMRWMNFLSRDPREQYKLCNDYRAPLARKLMTEEPELNGFFKTRDSKVDVVQGRAA